MKRLKNSLTGFKVKIVFNINDLPDLQTTVFAFDEEEAGY